MKLAIIIIISFVFVGIIGSFGGTYYFYLHSNEILEQSVFTNLETAAYSRVNHINDLLNEQKEDVEILASSFVFKRLFDKNSSEYEENLEDACKRVNKIVELDNTIYELSILDVNGKIICSNFEKNIGLDQSENIYFTEGLKGTYIKDAHLSSSIGKSSIDFSTPIICEIRGCLGVMVAKVEMSVIDKIVGEKTGLGETGEIYLINKEGYMITPSKFKQDTFLKEKIDSINAKNCLISFKETVMGHEGKKHLGHEAFVIYQDYRRAKVLGTHYPLNLIDWCLIAKIDEVDAFGSYRKELLKTSLITLISLIIFISLIGFIVARYISKPLKILTADVDEITKGKLDIELRKSNIFEIQNLTDSLNRILASLKLAILKTGGKTELMLGKKKVEVPKSKFSETFKVEKEKTVSKPVVKKVVIPIKKVVKK